MIDDEVFLSLDQGLLEDLEPALLAPTSFMNEILGRENHRQLEALSRLSRHLSVGVPGPAIVVACHPLQVAAYGAKIDKCVLLEFLETPQCATRLEVGARLLAILDYHDYRANDLVGGTGPEKWTNFAPLVADFLSSEAYRIASALQTIPEKEWKRCEMLIPEFAANNIAPRKGIPTQCGFPRAAAAGEG